MKQCQRCKGSGMLSAYLKNDYVPSIFGCEDCCGKGYRGWPGDDSNRAYAGTSYRYESPYGPCIFKQEETQ